MIKLCYICGRDCERVGYNPVTACFKCKAERQRESTRKRIRLGIPPKKRIPKLEQLPILGHELRPCEIEGCEWVEGIQRRGYYVGRVHCCPTHAREFRLIDNVWVRIPAGDKGVDKPMTEVYDIGNERPAEKTQSDITAHREMGENGQAKTGARIPVGPY